LRHVRCQLQQPAHPLLLKPRRDDGGGPRPRPARRAAAMRNPGMLSRRDAHTASAINDDTSSTRPAASSSARRRRDAARLRRRGGAPRARVPCRARTHGQLKNGVLPDRAVRARAQTRRPARSSSTSSKHATARARQGASDGRSPSPSSSDDEALRALARRRRLSAGGTGRLRAGLKPRVGVRAFTHPPTATPVLRGRALDGVGDLNVGTGNRWQRRVGVGRGPRSQQRGRSDAPRGWWGRGVSATRLAMPCARGRLPRPVQPCTRRAPGLRYMGVIRGLLLGPGMGCCQFAERRSCSRELNFGDAAVTSRLT
jgi:hypothetical protein